MHGDVAIAQMSEREHLSAAGRASASDYVPIPTEWSVGSVFVPSVVGASGPSRCVAWRTFQSFSIGFERNPFLLRGTVEICNKKQRNWHPERTKIDHITGVGFQSHMSDEFIYTLVLSVGV